MKTVGIIGAGIGGLSVAIHLASKGFKVTVFEKNAMPGGKASSLIHQGYRFDTGPSLLTMIDVVEQLFQEAGEKLSDYLNVKRLDVLCKYFYPDGIQLNAYSDFNKFAVELESKTSDTSANLSKYFSYSKEIFDLTKKIFLYDTYKGIKSVINSDSLKTLFKIHRIDSSRSMHDANKHFFTDPKLVQLFDRYATYNGSNPYLAPATLNLISHVENSLGGYYISDGMYSLVKALWNLALKKGVNFKFNHDVSAVKKSGNNIESLISENKPYSFDYYVSNLDSLTANKYFFGGNDFEINNDRLSSSAMVFYWGMNNEFPLLETHNILFSSDYKKEFDNLFLEKTIADDITVYIYISSKFNSSDAPAGCENWFVMINTPPNLGQNWNELIDKYRNIIIDKIELALKTEIRSKILFEKTLTPEIIEKQTGSYKGSLYGLSSNSRYSAFKRQSNYSKKYKNLFYCGGSAHPGGGIPLVILSGKNVSELIDDSQYFKD